jgi:hypothetical protein
LLGGDEAVVVRNGEVGDRRRFVPGSWNETCAVP